MRAARNDIWTTQNTRSGIIASNSMTNTEEGIGQLLEGLRYRRLLFCNIFDALRLSIGDQSIH